MASTGGHTKMATPTKSRKSVEDSEDKYPDSRTIAELRARLDNRMESLRQSNTTKDAHHKEKPDLDALRLELRRCREVLADTDKYLGADLQSAVTDLRDSLHRHASDIHKKLKHEAVNFEDEEPRSRSELEHLRETSSEQQSLAKIAMEMKKLEEISTRMTGQVERLSLAIEAANRDAQEIEDHLNRDLENSSEKMRREQLQREEEEEKRRLEEEEMERGRTREEERRRREEEEERLRKIEEEKLKKEDPRYWQNVIFFEAAEETDALGSGVAAVLRVPTSVSLDKPQLLCSTVDLLANAYPLAEYEELVSSMVTVRPADGREIRFENAVWLALPFAAGPRTRETVIRIQRIRRRPVTPPEKTDEEKLPEEQTDEGEQTENKTNRDQEETKDADKEETEAAVWEDTLTRDTTVEGQVFIYSYIQNNIYTEHFRFVETYLRHLPADGINVVVLTRFKRDHQTFNNKGGKLVSTLDHRVAIVCPKNGFRLTTDMSMQTIPLDTTAIAGLKERFDGCDHLLGTSPIVRLTASNKPNKPLTYHVTLPTGGSKAKRTRTMTGNGKDGESKDTSLPKPGKNNTIYNRNHDEDGEVDFVAVLTKESLGRAWRVREDVSIEFQKDVATFQLPNVVERFVLLRTGSRLESSDLVKVAANLETSQQEKPVAILVRQNSQDATRVAIECCKRDSVDRIAQRLKDERFSQGQGQGQGPVVVFLREGDVIEVGFNPKGNVDFADRRVRRLVFFSNLTSTCRTLVEVEEVDVFAQNALDHFRGSMRMKLCGRNYRAPSKLQPNNIRDNSNNSNNSNGTELLCEFSIVLPKPQKELTQVKKIRLPIKADGPLSEEYFNQLAVDLGDEWCQMASHLRVSKASVQRITTTYAHLDGVEATRKCIKDVLREWFLSSTKSKDKVDDLRLALLNAGRNDLAEELVTKSRELRQDIERRQQEASLTKCVRAYCASQAAVRSWRAVAKALGLREEDIRRIAGDQKEATVEMATGMLHRWKELRGNAATKENLIVTLRKLKLNEAAGNVSLIR